MSTVTQTSDKQMRVGVWNIEWATPKSRRAPEIHQHLDDMAADILCLCEAYSGFRDGHGHWIECGEDYGYRITAGRRKVMLWSRQPWHDVDVTGDAALPPGRFVAGTTQTPLGLVRVIGVCIPWSHAHVRTGSRDRRAWQDHEQYLHGLAGILKTFDPAVPTLIVGDFNQRLPRGRAPGRLHELLVNALRQNFGVLSQGIIDGLEQPLVCHVAATRHFSCSGIHGIAKVSGGQRLSDHDGLVVTLDGIDTAMNGGD